MDKGAWARACPHGQEGGEDEPVHTFCGEVEGSIFPILCGRP